MRIILRISCWSSLGSEDKSFQCLNRFHRYVARLVPSFMRITWIFWSFYLINLRYQFVEGAFWLSSFGADFKRRRYVRMLQCVLSHYMHGFKFNARFYINNNSQGIPKLDWNFAKLLAQDYRHMIGGDTKKTHTINLYCGFAQVFPQLIIIRLNVNSKWTEVRRGYVTRWRL